MPDETCIVDGQHYGLTAPPGLDQPALPPIPPPLLESGGAIKALQIEVGELRKDIAAVHNESRSLADAFHGSRSGRIAGSGSRDEEEGLVLVEVGTVLQ